jgi:signal transduction histidine kinase
MADLLGQLGRATTGRTGVPVTVKTEGEWQLPPAVQIGLYRIAQEALNNASKHAMANRMEMHFWCKAGRATLTIRDDGRGFNLDDVPPGHFGIGIMRERAESIGARLRIESELGRGVEVSVEWEPNERRKTKDE